MSFIFDAINWKLKIMKKWLCKICFLWENKNRTVVIFLLVGLFENMKKIDDIDLKTETDSILKLSSLLDDKKKIVVRISNAACVSCIQDFCAVLFQYFSGSEIIYISDYGSAKELFFMKQILGI